ncbi:hypothetical protein I3271_06980 [Photobacterium leiognathi]|uniref:Ivy family c-type lysozyme inhibitor n=1 Tax=Photobacterium leiognathi TaxID=553611 RepID=UPI001EDEC56F|nr:Ivy family c-type lysozyme inhibitor [Photobacterium leiognathi]MCG3884429.1 hypothetical protein [Photobacterium leiognathi]
MKKTLACILALSFGVCSFSISAKTPEYPFDWLKYPEKHQNFSKQYNTYINNNKIMRNVDWLQTLSLGTPIESVGDTGLVRLWSCKPHDCGDNSINMLYNKSTGQLFGIYETIDRNDGSTVSVIFGDRDADNEQLLMSIKDL